MVVMVKKLIALALAASMAVSGMTALAYNDKVIYAETSIKDSIGLFSTDSGETAELFNNDSLQTLYDRIDAEIKEKQVQGEKCEVTVKGLDNLNVECKTNDDANKILTVFQSIISSYNVMAISGKYNTSDCMSEITISIDNSLTVDAVAESIAENARLRLSDPDKYNKYSDVYSEYPIVFFKSNEKELLSKIQAAAPELCYIQISDIAMGTGIKYSQTGSNFTVPVEYSVIIDYLPITRDEYTAFENKLDAIVSAVVYPDMTDVQKAMALHDWIVDNVDYGYRLDRSIYSDDVGSDIIYNLEEFNKLPELIGENATMMNDKTMAHTAYAPAMLGYGVCQGYSMLYSALLNKVGIENGTVASFNMNHQWSTVKLDGEWYHTDVTWDDPTPQDSDTESYKTRTLRSGVNTIDLQYQTKAYHQYSNFLCSGETFAENGHITDGAYFIPEAEFTDNTYHARDDELNENTAHYVFDRVSGTKLYYGCMNNMYYYEQVVRYVKPGTNETDKIVTEYYKLPFSLKNTDGTFAEPVEVTKEEFDKAVSGIVDYVTVTVPDEDIINNSVTVEYKFEGEENEELSVANIGTAVITVKPADITEPNGAVESVDAYLVYYGENNTVKAVVKKTIQLDENGEIRFRKPMPEGAVAAKIIILDAGKDLQPVIKAIGVQTVPTEQEQPEQPTQTEQPAA